MVVCCACGRERLADLVVCIRCETTSGCQGQDSSGCSASKLSRRPANRESSRRTGVPKEWSSRSTESTDGSGLDNKRDGREMKSVGGQATIENDDERPAKRDERWTEGHRHATMDTFEKVTKIASLGETKWSTGHGEDSTSGVTRGRSKECVPLEEGESWHAVKRRCTEGQGKVRLGRWGRVRRGRQGNEMTIQTTRSRLA